MFGTIIEKINNKFFAGRTSSKKDAFCCLGALIFSFVLTSFVFSDSKYGFSRMFGKGCLLLTFLSFLAFLYFRFFGKKLPPVLDTEFSFPDSEAIEQTAMLFEEECRKKINSCSVSIVAYVLALILVLGICSTLEGLPGASLLIGLMLIIALAPLIMTVTKAAQIIDVRSKLMMAKDGAFRIGRVEFSSKNASEYARTNGTRSHNCTALLRDESGVVILASVVESQYYRLEEGCEVYLIEMNGEYNNGITDIYLPMKRKKKDTSEEKSE